MVTINPNIMPKAFFDQDTGELTVSKKQAEAVQSGIQAKIENMPPAEKRLFLQQVANLAPGDVSTPQKLDEMLDRFEAAASKLASLFDSSAFVGDIAKFLGRALIEFAAEQRKNALDERMAAREAAKAELMSQAGKMEAAAEKMMTGAITNLVMGVAAGAISIAGGIASSVGSFAAIGKMSAAMKSGSDQAFKSAEALSTAFSGIGSAVRSGGDMIGAGGRGAEGITQAEAKKTEAEGSRDAADAQFQQQTADLKKDIQQQMDEMIKQIINFLKEMREAEVDAMRALTKV